MGQHVPDVGHAGEVHDHPLEAQAEAGVAAATVAAQVALELVGLRVHPQLLDAAFQNVQPLLTLGTADDLADAGH